MLKEFKEFAFKGNMIDLAVGLILGGAFATVIKSLVSDVIMPLLGMLGTAKDFTNVYIPLQGQDPTLPLEAAREEGAVVALGLFLNNLIAFLVVSFLIFLIVHRVMKVFKRDKREAEEAPPEPSKEEVLLTEIRDLLKEKA